MKDILGIKLYSTKEVSIMLGVQAQTVRKYIKEGKIKSQMIGNVNYMTEEAIKDFVKND